jgi:capsular exopolysaccharide synthesis family protein
MPVLMLGLIFGCLAGLGLAVILDRMDDRLHSVDQVEQLTGLAVLGLVPRVPRRHRAKPEEYTLSHPHSLYAESLRATHTALRLSAPHRRTQVVLVTSALPGEGKTKFCLSLARSLAETGHRVLLIDADLRRPAIAMALRGAEGRGLGRLLRGEIELDQAIQEDRRSGACYIAGERLRMDPRSVLGSDGFAALIEHLRAQFDSILIDSPPLLAASDAAVLAHDADRCLFFVRWGWTSKALVVTALRRLALHNVSLDGVVLARIDTRRHATYSFGEAYHCAYE